MDNPVGRINVLRILDALINTILHFTYDKTSSVPRYTHFQNLGRSLLKFRVSLQAEPVHRNV